PAKTLCQFDTRQRGRPFLEKSVFLLRRLDVLIRVHIEKMIGLYCELGEKVRRILVYASEPLRRDSILNARHMADTISRSDGHRITQGLLMPDDNALCRIRC